SIPRRDECPPLKEKGHRMQDLLISHLQSAQSRCSETEDTITQELPTWKNRLARGAARDRQLLCQRRRRIPFCLFANRPTESLAVILCARMSPVLECAT